MLTIPPGAIFAQRYEVVRAISTGGMGAVYEIHDRGTRRRRALKVLLPALVMVDDMRRRFAFEAVVTADIESEHLVEVFDAGIDAQTGIPFLVMELLRGEDVGRRLAREGPMPVTDVLTIAGQVARTLDKTHKAAIVHRDLKPENLFLTQRDDGSLRVKILDFGIAKIVARSRADAAAKSTRSLGTPLFMAPEQFKREGMGITPATDLYALGHIVFALLAGVPYFKEESEHENGLMHVLWAVANGTIEPASSRSARYGRPLPQTLDAWFKKATSVDPSQRFASASEMLEGLAAALGASASDVSSSPRLEGRGANLTDSAPQPLPVAVTPAPSPSGRSDARSAISQPQKPIDTASVDPTVAATANFPPRTHGRAFVFVALGLAVAAAVVVVVWMRAEGRSPAAETAAVPVESAPIAEVPVDTASASAPAEAPPVDAGATASAEATRPVVTPPPAAAARAPTTSGPRKPVTSPSPAPGTAAPAPAPWEERTPLPR